MIINHRAAFALAACGVPTYIGFAFQASSPKLPKGRRKLAHFFWRWGDALQEFTGARSLCLAPRCTAR